MNKLIFSLILTGVISVVRAQEPVIQAASAQQAYVANIPDASQKSGSAAGREGDDVVRTRSFSRTFPADRSDKVSLNNQFGTMLIKVWDKREVKIDIEIRAVSNSEKDAQQMVDQVSIDAAKSGDQISCKTNIDSQKRWSFNGRRRDVRVNYTVYIPASLALALSQQFGNVTLDDLSGPLSAKVQYGDLNAGNLAGDNNYISVQYGKTTIEELNKATIRQQYGSGLHIGTVRELDLDVQYANVEIGTVRGDALIKQQYGSGLKIGSVNNLTLNVQYANVNVKTIRGNATIKQQYNSLQIGSVGKLDLKAEYAGVTIGALRGDGQFKMSYNRCAVDEISPSCRNLNMDVDYVDLQLNFAEGYHADFSVRKSYGSFRYGPEVKAMLNADDDRGSSTKRYTGKIGNGGAATVTVKSEYGSVVFK